MAENEENEVISKLENVREIGERLKEIIADLSAIVAGIEVGEESEEEKMVGEIAATRAKKIQTLGEEK